MARKPRRRPGFLATVVIPLVAGSAITLAGVGGLMLRTDGGPRVVLRTATTDEIEKSPLRKAGGGLLVVRQEEPVRREETGAVPRNVTPAGVTPGPKVVGPLMRVEPQVVDIGLPPPKVPETLYRRVVVLDAGSFRSVVDKKAVMVRIAGIEPPSFDAMCTDGDGARWKCGARARAELARLIGGRAVSCTTTDASQDLAPLMRCRVGQTDLAAWLVGNGWADPAGDAPAELANLAAKARETKKGRFGSAPLGVIAG